MGLGKKNFNLGFTEKSDFQVGGQEKPIYRGELPRKWGAWTVWKFKERLDEKEWDGVFEGGLIPQCTL